MAESPDVDNKDVDSPCGAIVMGKDSRNTTVVSKEEWKGFAQRVQFSNNKNYQTFLRLAKSCRPKALRSCFSPTVASKCILHQAAKQGANDVVRVLLSFEEVDINNVDGDKKTALHYAASEGYVQIVILLLENDKIHANLQDSKGNTPLHYAAKWGYALIVEKILKATTEVDVSSTNVDKRTPLHLGAMGGYTKTVRLLLERGDPTQQDSGGNTALHLAASCGHGAIVEMLTKIPEVDVNAINDPDKDTPLHLAARREVKSVIDLLLQHKDVRVDLENNHGKTPLYYATSTARGPILKKLLETSTEDASFDINGTEKMEDIFMDLAVSKVLDDSLSILPTKEGYCLVRSKGHGGTQTHVHVFHLAAKLGLAFLIPSLLQNVDVNAVDVCNQTALHLATSGGHLEVVKILLDDPHVNAWMGNEEGDTPLHEATRIGRQDFVKTYLAIEDADVNVPNKKMETPMLLGASHGHVDVVELLLEQSNVEPSRQDCDGNSPIHVAAQNGHADIVERLLRQNHDVDVNCINGTNGNTPLHFCVEEGHETVVEFLLKQPKVDATLVDLCGESPLHKAAKRGDEGIFAKILRAPGVDVNGINKHHDTVLHVAVREGYVGILDLLLKKEGLDATLRNRDGKIAVHIAARNGEETIVKKILGYGVNVNTKDKDNATALHMAAEEGRVSIVINFLDDHRVKASTYDDQGLTPLLHAAEKGHDRIVQLLLSHGVHVNERRWGHGMTALGYAASNRYSQVVDIILQSSSVDPNIGSEHPLVCAVKKGHVDVVGKTLAFSGIDVNSHQFDGGYTALHYLVANNGSDEVVRLLLKTQGIDMNCQTDQGETALHLALSINVTKKSRYVVRIFLDIPGIDLNIKNKIGEGILFHAARQNDYRLLMEIYNASKVNTGSDKDFTLDFNEVNDEGDSIIHLAARCGFIKVFDFLLGIEDAPGNNVDMNKKTSPKKTAGRIEGAFSNGETALEIAIKEKKHAIIKILTKFKHISFISEDGEGRPTLLQGTFEREGKDSDIFKFLRRIPEVKNYIDAVYKDRQSSVDAANAILVGAALIASVTFASWLQPPLGYATYYHEELVDTFPAPPVSYPQYVAFDHHPILRMFWVCNSLSFFFAIATVISGARSVLPTRKLFIQQEVLNLQRNLLITSTLLSVSMFFVLLAFATAGITVLPPILRFRKNIYITIGIGGSVCLVLQGYLVKNICELLIYEIKNSGMYRLRNNDQVGLITRAHKTWIAICDCVRMRGQSSPSND